MFVYFMLLYIASLFNPKARLLVKGQRAAWQLLKEKLQPGTRYVWFHAASVGEFEQARPVIERLKADQPSRKIILTFFSPSGYEMRKDYPQADIVCYLPFATRRNAKRFISLLQPEMAIFVKYEFWPAYLRTLKAQGIPTYIFAAIFRKEQTFFKWYGAGYRRLLTCFTRLFVQDESSRELLAKYKITNVEVAGDTRFDRVTHIAAQSREIPAVIRFVEPEVTPLSIIQPEVPKVLVAGSTWPQDEALLVKYCQTHPAVKLILTPHEIDEKHLHYIFNLFQGRFVRYSEANFQNVTTTQVLLMDTMGMLSSVYKYGQVAYVGGGFGEGIHNTIEAAVYGMPVIFGPNCKRFREAQGLIAADAGKSVHGYDELEAALDDAFARSQEMGQKADAYVKQELGATEHIYSAIFRS